MTTKAKSKQAQDVLIRAAQRKFDRARFLERLSGDAAIDLYNALLTIVRQNAQQHPYGHDAIIGARTALARASNRAGLPVNWAKERLL